MGVRVTKDREITTKGIDINITMWYNMYSRTNYKQYKPNLTLLGTT